MNKHYQEEQFRQLLMNSILKPGLYLIDTDLSDEEVETFIKNTGLCSYEKEARSIAGSSSGSNFGY